MKEVDEITGWLEENGNSENIEGMSRFGINAEYAYGVRMPLLRARAREYRRRHDVALALWETGIHEARILASLTADPKLLTSGQMDRWVEGFDSWDVCDQCCINLFRHVDYVYDKIPVYVADEREFVRRTGFVLMAVLAVHDKKLPDEEFVRWLDIVGKYSCDGRNLVKKAVNWALRQIGKRNLALNAIAAERAALLARGNDPAARWTGKDALKELTSPRTLDFIRKHRRNNGRDYR